MEAGHGVAGHRWPNAVRGERTVVECTACGERAEAGVQFCGGCGAFLEWSEPAAATAGREARTGPGAAAEAPAAPSAPTATPGPGSAPAPGDPSPGGARTSSAPPASSTRTPPTSAGPHVVFPGPPAVPPIMPPAEPRAPVRESVAAPVQPGVGEPAAVRPRGTARPAPEEPPPAPGDLICGQCGAGNVPARRFCRRCGASLADAPVMARPPWWRRLFAGRPRTAPAAGERPAPGLLTRLRSLRRPRLLVPLLVVALAAAGLSLRSQLLKAGDTVKDRVARTEQVHATGVTASSTLRGHAAALAVDGTTDRYWAPARSGDGTGQYLEARFDQAFRLLDLVVYPGTSTTEQQFLTQARPRALEVTATDSHGRASHHTVTLADSPGAQKFHLAVSDVVRIRLTVHGAYGTGPGRHVAVGEVEFFKRG
jgi:hypothetical protein